MVEAGKGFGGSEPPILWGGGQTGPMSDRRRVSGYRWRGGGSCGRATVFAANLGRRFAAPGKGWGSQGYEIPDQT